MNTIGKLLAISILFLIVGCSGGGNDGSMGGTGNIQTDMGNETDMGNGFYNNQTQGSGTVTNNGNTVTM